MKTLRKISLIILLNIEFLVKIYQLFTNFLVTCLRTIIYTVIIVNTIGGAILLLFAYKDHIFKWIK